MIESLYARIKNAAQKFALTAGHNLPLVPALSSRYPVILLYHGVPATGDNATVDGPVLERHITFLKRSCNFVTQEQLRTSRKALDKIQVLLTFDDGLRNNAEVVAPILRKHKVPAIFFVSSRHSIPGKYLWFIYLSALEKYFRGNGFSFRGEFIDMSPEQRQASMSRLSEFLLHVTPHPVAMYQVIEEELPQLEDFLSPKTLADHYAGMTADQVGELATDPLFTIGAHTVDHPFLTACAHEEALQQIQNNKRWIEEVSNQPCNAIAYPGGDYNAEVLQHNRTLGLTHGYAVSPTLCRARHHEIPRIGIYSPSVDILRCKVQWGNSMRALRIKIG